MLVDVLLLTREGLDDAVVRRLTSVLFDVLRSSRPAMISFDSRMRDAPATPIPPHAGAARITAKGVVPVNDG